MSQLRVRLFGRFVIERDGTIATRFGPAKVQELFCYLLVKRDRPHAREQEASPLWGETTTAQVVEDDSTPRESSVRQALALDPTFVCDSLDWTALVPDVLARRTPHGLVAVAVPATARVAHVFESLRDRPTRTPTLVVLPGQPSDPIVELAATISDDLLFSPLRLIAMAEGGTLFIDEIDALSLPAQGKPPPDTATPARRRRRIRRRRRDGARDAAVV